MALGCSSQTYLLKYLCIRIYGAHLLLHGLISCLPVCGLDLVFQHLLLSQNIVCLTNGCGQIPLVPEAWLYVGEGQPQAQGQGGRVHQAVVVNPPVVAQADGDVERGVYSLQLLEDVDGF